jgi:succinate-acetate transporter protein
MTIMRVLAIAIIYGGLLSLVIGVISHFMGSDIVGFSPNSFGLATGICFLLSINLLLLENKS